MLLAALKISFQRFNVSDKDVDNCIQGLKRKYESKSYIDFSFPYGVIFIQQNEDNGTSLRNMNWEYQMRKQKLSFPGDTSDVSYL